MVQFDAISNEVKGVRSRFAGGAGRKLQSTEAVNVFRSTRHQDVRERSHGYLGVRNVSTLSAGRSGNDGFPIAANELNTIAASIATVLAIGHALQATADASANAERAA